MSGKRSGSCFCGTIKYELTADPIFVHCCHCLDCQKQTGGAFAINALIERSNVRLTHGEPVPTRMPTDSGQPHDIWRCARCQTALWSFYGGREAIAFLRVSTLDEPHGIVPDVHIFTRSKVPWVGLPPDARAFDVYYSTKAEWPAESLARREAALSHK
jgi:hypothetical protein